MQKRGYKLLSKKIGVDAIPTESIKEVYEKVKEKIEINDFEIIKNDLIDDWIGYMPKVCWDGIFYYSEMKFKPYSPSKANTFEFLWGIWEMENITKEEVFLDNHKKYMKELLASFKKYIGETDPFMLMEQFRKESIKFWNEKKKLNKKLNIMLVKMKLANKENMDSLYQITNDYLDGKMKIKLKKSEGINEFYFIKFGLAQVRTEMYSRIWDILGKCKKEELEDVRSFYNDKTVLDKYVHKNDIDGWHYIDRPYFSSESVVKIIPRGLNKKWFSIFEADGSIRAEIFVTLRELGCIENVIKLQDILMNLKEIKDKLIDSLKFYSNLNLGN